jgi:hypothetical protein
MFMDPHTQKLLAEFVAKELLEQAEKDHLARQVSQRDSRFLSRIGTLASNWLRPAKAPAPEPLRRTSAETHS